MTYSDSVRLDGLNLFPYTFAFGPAAQHQHHQFFAVWKPADIALIPPLVVFVVEAAVEQRPWVCQRAEYSSLLWRTTRMYRSAEQRHLLHGG